MSKLHITFDAVLYAVKTVASFYILKYEHIKRDMVGCAYVVVSNSLGYVFAKI